MVRPVRLPNAAEMTTDISPALFAEHLNAAKEVPDTRFCCRTGSASLQQRRQNWTDESIAAARFAQYTGPDGKLPHPFNRTSHFW